MSEQHTMLTLILPKRRKRGSMERRSANKISASQICMSGQSNQ